jgi:rhodanese-related sulfurtransferase
MKKLFSISILLSMLLALALSSCKEESTTPEQTEFEILSKYVTDNNLDFPNITNWVTGGSKINVNATDFSVPDYYVIDLRAKADFDLGHIKDAHNTTLANLLTEVAALPKDKKILVTCYTGQTAARGVAALRMMGYINSTILKWGMASWHADFASRWNSNATDFASPNWVTSGTPVAPTTFIAPEIKTNETDGAKILEARVKTMLSNASWSVAKTDILANPGNYFINNYWPQVSWDAFGHINGAYRIFEDLKVANLTNLDPSKTGVIYCYTGQTSGIVSGWLEIMGYSNFKSLSYGVNGINYTGLVGSDVDAAKTKTWKGAGSGSVNNFGYYDSNNVFHGPQ